VPQARAVLPADGIGERRSTSTPAADRAGQRRGGDLSQVVRDLDEAGIAIDDIGLRDRPSTTSSWP
jgi:hypothetical protein